MIKILFDNRCSLCKREINYYKSISPKGIFHWCDLHKNNALLYKYKITRQDALLSLHAIDEKKILYKGVDAFCIIWRELKWWNILSIVVKMPIIYRISKIFYRHFAAWRFKKLNYCKVD